MAKHPGLALRFKTSIIIVFLLLSTSTLQPSQLTPDQDHKLEKNGYIYCGDKSDKEILNEIKHQIRQCQRHRDKHFDGQLVKEKKFADELNNEWENAREICQSEIRLQAIEEAKESSLFSMLFL